MSTYNFTARIFSIIGCNLDIRNIDFVGSVGKNTGAAFSVAELIGSLDHPVCRLLLSRRPGLTHGPHFAVWQILNPKFEPVPGVSFPGEGLGHSAFLFDLP